MCFMLSFCYLLNAPEPVAAVLPSSLRASQLRLPPLMEENWPDIVAVVSRASLMIPPTLNEPSALMLPVPPAPLKMGLELGSKTFRLALLMAAVPKLTEKPAFQSFPSSAFQEVLPPVANVPLMTRTLRPRPPGPPGVCRPWR